MIMYFSREDWKLFRNIETLSQKAGVRKEMIPGLVAKELVDNALDAGAHCDIRELPGQNGFYVQDDGPGIPPERLGELFSINRPMVSSKLLRLPTRGALGNGLRVVMGAVTATGGTLSVSTHGKEFALVPLEDGSTNVSIKGNAVNTRGTRVQVVFGKGIRLTFNAITMGRNAIDFAAGEDFKCKTSAWWYTSESFYELLNAYPGTLPELMQHFDIQQRKYFKDSVGEYWDRLTSTLTFDETEVVLRVLRTSSKASKKPKIGFVGKDVHTWYNGYSKQTGQFHISSARGNFDAYVPYVVEAWLGVDNNLEEPDVMMMVNKTPITGEIQTWKKDSRHVVIYGCGLTHRFKSKPAHIIINVQTPYMPITSDGKAPNFHPMVSGINTVIERAARGATKTINAADTRKLRTEKDVILNFMDEAIEKASGFGTYKFSQRQLYYAVRPYVISRLDKEPDYNYFCRVLTEYEAEYGDIPNLYRDPRGILYHPHLGEEIPIGTIAVENYTRPAWTFNKILYSEKEGFFTILRDAKFPERYDCALLTSKGYASRAVKDLFDLLGDTDEEIYFFCIHDADAAGTKIYETLQGATLARPGRRIKVINLGLEPEEALSMGLEVEKVPEAKHRKPVADYLDDEWRDWLQEKRVELNAMTSPQFLAWLEGKMEEHGIPKVIPAVSVMRDTLEAQVSKLLKDRIAEDILRKAGYDERVRAEIARLRPHITSTPLRQVVQDDLELNQERHWTNSIRDIAKKLVV